MIRKAAVDAAVAKATGRDANGRFVAGAEHKMRQGRKRGSKNKLSAAFIADLFAMWERHGAEILRLAMDKDPAAIVEAMAYLTPQRMPSIDTRDDRFVDMLEYVSADVDRMKRDGTWAAPATPAPAMAAAPATVITERPDERRARLKRQRFDDISDALNRSR